MTSFTLKEYQLYLKTKYNNREWTASLFMKLVEEVGEVAKAINKIDGRKKDDGLSSLSEELSDVIHYAIAIATINGINLENIILEKDEIASIKYKQSPNLKEFLGFKE